MSRFNVPLGDTGRAQDRVIRMTNVHFDATAEEVAQLFTGFHIIDQIRDMNVRTKTKSVVYVLFATQQERIEAASLDGRPLRGRFVKIQPAPTGTYRIKDDHSGFVRKGETVTEVVSQNFDVVPQLDDDEFPALSMPPRRCAPQPGFVRPALPALTAPYRPTRASLSSQDIPQKRIVFLNDMHLRTRDDEIVLFFDGYNPAAVHRMKNAQTGNNTSSSWVLMETMEDRNRAVEERNGAKLHGTKVSLEVPLTIPQLVLASLLGSTGDRFAEHAEYGSPQQNLPFFPARDDSPRRHIRGPSSLSAQDNKSYIDTLLSGLGGMDENKNQSKSPLAKAPGGNEQGETPNSGYAAAQFMFPNAQQNHQKEAQAAEDARVEEYNRKFHKALKNKSSPFGAVGDGRPRGPPVGVDTAIPPRDENWNLAGDNNYNLFTAEQWNNWGADQARKVRDGIEKKGTQADRINREGGRGGGNQ